MQAENADIILLSIAITLILLFLLSFIAAILFLYQKKNILYNQQLEDEKNNYEKNILQTQLEIQEQTFQHISREIHDNIGLSLTLAKLQLNTINYVDAQKTKDNVDSSIALIGKAIIDLSDISKSFNSEVIKNQGLYSMLKVETDKINASGNIRVEFLEEGDIVFLDAEKELIIYRIAQEALNNILKHSSASLVLIKLKYEIKFVKLSIEDNGIGFKKIEIEKYRSGKLNSGLLNMRSRAIMLNGTFTVNSGTDTGTIITITAPY
ncbi:MAG: ATP-binding protein [Bacteroidota bacterium]